MPGKFITTEDIVEMVRLAHKYAIKPVRCEDCGKEYYWPDCKGKLYCTDHVAGDLAIEATVYNTIHNWN